MLARPSLTATARTRGVVADGHTNEEIAAILHLGLDTVKRYVSRVFVAARVRDRAELFKLVSVNHLPDQVTAGRHHLDSPESCVRRLIRLVAIKEFQ
ncbi:LuxR C-terminal-related transcriptional regulator [Gordonia terrae]|uniref:LuxR C-terminal-related transcriptional regulator n=1 Tax=Gordonia terrae TaxID=2055 RepID=UPI003CC7E84D